MKMLKILVVKIYHLIGKLQASAMTFGIAKGYFISVSLGIITIVSILMNSRISITNDIEFSSIWTLILTIISTGSTIISSIVGYRHSSSSYQVIYSYEYKNQVVKSTQLTDQYLRNGYEIHDCLIGSNKESFVMSESINHRLINSDINFILNKEKFCIADEIKPKIPSIIRSFFNKNVIIFNGKLIRLSSDLYLDSIELEIQNTKYFDGLCTNEIVFKRIKNVHILNDVFKGENLLLDIQNNLIDLNLSFCSNYIGASTLVFTKNKKIIIGKQGQNSATNVNRYSPSGSGSIDKKDLMNANSFNELLVNAMEREFCEENNYKYKDVCLDLSSYVIGYCRLLERGGKPDFFGVTYFDREIENVNKLNTLELGLSSNSELLDFHDKSPKLVFEEFCNEKARNGNLSIQLHIINEIYKTVDLYELLKPKILNE